MVVSAATNYAAANEPVMSWLATHRKARTQSIVDRIAAAAQDGELAPARTYRPWAITTPPCCTACRCKRATA